MSERKHTPGPWRLSGHSEDSPEKLSVEDGNGYFIAEVDFGLAQKANARLIAAAPELLEALKELVKANEDHNESVSKVIGELPGWKDSYLDKARSAIAKALGEE